MADYQVPDYPLEESLHLESPEQFRALFEETRLQIADLLTARAATTSEIAETLAKPKGTIGHHLGVMEEAGLVTVVRTKKVRAIEAKYYGRTARTFVISSRIKGSVEVSPDYFLTSAAAEYASAAGSNEKEAPMISTLRYVRIPDSRAAEWVLRIGELAQEFVSEERGGDVTYGLLLALYPTARPHLPDSTKEE